MRKGHKAVFCVFIAFIVVAVAMMVMLFDWRPWAHGAGQDIPERFKIIDAPLVEVGPVLPLVIYDAEGKKVLVVDAGGKVILRGKVIATDHRLAELLAEFGLSEWKGAGLVRCPIIVDNAPPRRIPRRPKPTPT